MQHVNELPLEKKGFVRRIYDWVLGWANTKYGTLALAAIAFAESSFFPVPPDVLLIALILGARSKAFGFATICTFSSILGAIFGYGLGYFVWWDSAEKFSPLALFFFDHVPGFTTTLFYNIKAMYNEWNFWIIFTAGFTPIPYKIFTVSAGAFSINFVMFIVASIVSRGARFFLVAALLWKFGDPIKNFIDRYFNLLAILFTILLIGGFVLIKYAIH